MNRLLSFIVALLSACVIFGGEPQIVELSPTQKNEAPKPNPPSDSLSIGAYRWFGIQSYDGPLTWHVEGVAAKSFETDTATKIIGTVEGTKAPSVYEVPAKALVAYGSEPGVFKISALGVVDGKPKVLAAKTLVVAGQGPQPPPHVDPEPAPVVAKKLFLRVVEETSERTPETAKIAAAQGYWDTLQTAGHRFMWYDKDSKEKAGLQAIKDAGTKPYPVVVVYDAETEKLLGVEPLGKSTADVDATIKKYTGNK